MRYDLVMIIAAVLLLAIGLMPRVWKSRNWRATVTPLASIIGSGFLVAGPILTDIMGSQAWIAMLGLCAIGYLYGSVMRHNIAHVEPRLGELPHGMMALERLSELMLSLAYFVSVAYYLNLFSAFGLRIAGIDDAFAIRVAATVVIAALGAIGFAGGLTALERIEVGTVNFKLSVIGGLLVALTLALVVAMAQNRPVMTAMPAADGDQIRIFLGLVILVQGFETSRYLGEEYDSQTRVRTMRHAQWISTAIYLLFIVAVGALFPAHLGDNSRVSETEIIDMLRPLGAFVAPALILAALASQSSAAIADTNGAGGLLSEATSGRISVKLGNLATAIAAVAITWSTDIFGIITWASKAFVAYYALQSVQATRSAWSCGRRGRAAVYALGILIAIAVILFARPVGA